MSARRRQSIRVAVAALAAGAVAAAGLIESGTSELSAGPAIDASAAVVGDVRDPAFPQGRFLYTTVEVRDLNLLQRAIHTVLHQLRVGGTGELVPKALPSGAPGDPLAVSKLVALELAAALADPEAAGTRVLVAAVNPGSPADEAGIEAGDVITGLGSSPTATPEELVALLAPRAEEPVTVEIDRGGIRLRLEATPEAREGVGRLGILALEVVDPGPLPDIDVATGEIHGSSAGLIFTLTFLDALSPGDLTGGRVISGTGTVDRAGTVGQIGGADLKLHGAIDAGAAVFLHPASNRLTVQDPSVETVPVESVRDALIWLCGHGATDAVCADLAAG